MAAGQGHGTAFREWPDAMLADRPAAANPGSAMAGRWPATQP
ncbi:hypothetical protein OCGS_1521 [Oceaniovalibus guishaninsula JLT2003]|uniref:Uncharacterized protein n=1 Tax=Oceaniovalibus guishaninsula JLT2003 TaxID=1231392 RepID=K2HB49_9RHOB|nr:hypothetical protein OCGS_1521 [Oceaniovalibus guishaninsula JLT2003]